MARNSISFLGWALGCAFIGCSLTAAGAAWIWVEGENPSVNRMNRHPWYDQVKREELSGGNAISNFHKEKPGEAEYEFTAQAAGEYEFWVRANPIAAALSYQLNDGLEVSIDLERNQIEPRNIATDGKADLRFVAWVNAGRVVLEEGRNRIRFGMTSRNHHHGLLDCFVFVSGPFEPRGTLKPDQIASERRRQIEANQGWVPFDPPTDPFKESAIDLRFLNETVAGENGFIAVLGVQFVHSATGKPVRFWAVNGPPESDSTSEDLRRTARLLAKRGVNLVRVHGAIFDRTGEADAAKIRRAWDIVDAMKAEGIYTLFSIYFPLWMRPAPGTPWLEGYDGSKHPFAAIFFNADFQAQYRSWWEALLTARHEQTGRRLVDDPAVMGLEMVNEDSFFFWTFQKDRLPEAQWRILEKQFGDWLKAKYGSIEAAMARWPGTADPRDQLAEGRVGFRPLWNIFNERTLRDQDTARFLFETQTAFYRETERFLRRLGFKGVITASNWATASPEVFGPLEKLSYSVGDFIDRHGYFSTGLKGENAAWSIRNGHSYVDRSALRFDGAAPGAPKQFVHPVMDPNYGKPSMISETTFERPNRYRTEAVPLFAAYGALQGSDAIVHFALDGGRWTVQPRFWMQPWTLMSPVMAGQFPAAALIFRQSLVRPGEQLAEVRLNTNDLFSLKGTPFPQDASFDELRARDLPSGQVKPGQRIDPLIHFAGRTAVHFGAGESEANVVSLEKLIDRSNQVVTSSTGELQLDYGKGLLTINAPKAQGLCGPLDQAGRMELSDISIQSGLELGAIILVPLDGEPLARSSRMLLQVMSEEKTSGFETKAQDGGRKEIVNIGRDPWLIRELSGVVKFKRPDASRLEVTALDANGYSTARLGSAEEIRLQPATIYYLISR
jgi:hypothetical protein